MSSPPRVLNGKGRKKADYPGAVYVGRYLGGWGSSRWGNPWKVGVHVDTRTEAVANYRAWLLDGLPPPPDWSGRTAAEVLAHVDELRGRDLVCSCTPEPCHANLLIVLANRSETRSA